jgi:Lon protease-like protein
MTSDELTPDGGVVRLFPLPNLVLFPGAVQPLHIFEPRYRQMTADALAGDRLIALVLPMPGWEKDYAGKPALHDVACVGRIGAEQQLADGRFNLLLHGLRRIRIIEEVSQAKLYRAARVEFLDEAAYSDVAEEAVFRQRLREHAPEWFGGQTELRDQFLGLIDSDLGLGVLIDLIAFALPLDPEFKQMLLEELNVPQRFERLLHQLSISRRPFPPEFSPN